MRCINSEQQNSSVRSADPLLLGPKLHNQSADMRREQKPPEENQLNVTFSAHLSCLRFRLTAEPHSCAQVWLACLPAGREKKCSHAGVFTAFPLTYHPVIGLSSRAPAGRGRGLCPRSFWHQTWPPGWAERWTAGPAANTRKWIFTNKTCEVSNPTDVFKVLNHASPQSLGAWSQLEPDFGSCHVVFL